MKKGKSKKLIIFKVQISLGSSDGVVSVLVYNKDQSLSYWGPAPKEIFELMGDEKKGFFMGWYDKKKKKIELTDEKASWQSW